MAAPFPIARFQRAGASPALITSLQAAWALLSPAVQDAEALYLEGLSDYQVASITALPVSGGGIPTPQPPQGNIILISEGTALAESAGSPLPSRGAINFKGGVTATDNPGLGTTDIDVSPSVASASSTPAQSPGFPWAINVVDGAYGALGTGVAEPATPFQNAYAAATTLGRDVFIPAGTYYVNDGTQASVFKLARDNARTGAKVRIVFDPGATIRLSALTPRLVDFNKQADFDWFRNVELVGNGATIDANNIGGIQHILMGTLQAGVNQSNINYEYLRANGFKVINAFTDSSDGTTNLRHTVWISPLGNATTDTYGQFCEFEDIKINPDGTAPDGSTAAGAHGGGGDGGITVGSAGATSKFHWDQLWIRRCRHDRGLVSETFAAADSFYIGSRGVGGQGGMKECFSRGAPDTAYEINGAHQGKLEDCLAVDPLNNGYLHRGANGGIDPTDLASKTEYLNCETRRIARTGSMRHMKFGVDTAGDFAYGVVEVQGGGADIQRNDDAAPNMYALASPNTYRLILLKDQDVYIKAGGSSANTTGSTLVASVVYADNGNGSVFRIRGMTVHLEGVVGVGAGYSRWTFDMRGNWVLDWDTIVIDDQQTFTGGTPGLAGAAIGKALASGGGKSDVRGRIRNLKGKNGAGILVDVGSFTTQQFGLSGTGADLLFLDQIDASEMQTGANAVNTSGTNLQKVVASNVYQRGQSGANPQPVTLASAATLTLPAFNPIGDIIQVTGTTGITAITAAWVGRVIRLQFTGIITVTDNGTTLNLAGNFTGPGFLTLYCDGTNWSELGRANP